MLGKATGKKRRELSPVKLLNAKMGRPLRASTRPVKVEMAENGCAMQLLLSVCHAGAGVRQRR
jgi:hypothetical protein